MKRRERPHLYALREFAQALDMYSLEFETAKLRFERKESAPPDGRRPEHYRPITSFGINHRARQHMVLMVLEACHRSRWHNSQFGIVGRGRDDAVRAVMTLTQSSNIEFVGEVDINNFYPSIGEVEDRRISSDNLLFHEFPFIPRAVIESSVLSARVLVSLPNTPGLEALSREFNTRTGIPQGSAVSSYIAQLVMLDLLTEAETLSAAHCATVGYVDNVAMLARNRDDVHLQKMALSACASGSRFGSLRLTLTETIRHKSNEFNFLGYRICHVVDEGGSYINRHISNKSQNKLRRRLLSELDRFQPTGLASENYKKRHADEVAKRIGYWAKGFSLVENAREVGWEVCSELLSEKFRTRRMLQALIKQSLAEQRPYPS